MRWKPVVAGAAIVVALSGWFFVRNQILYGMAAPTGYEGMMAPNQAPYEEIPYLSRRPLALSASGTAQSCSHPYVPTGYRPQPRFFPVLVASTFSDFYRYCLAAWQLKVPVYFIHHRPVPVRAFELSRFSMMGGGHRAADAARLVLAPRRGSGGGRAIRGGCCSFRSWRSSARCTSRPSIRTTTSGRSRGPTCSSWRRSSVGLFGLAVAWMWRRVWARAGAVVAFAALLLVFIYSADPFRVSAPAPVTAAPLLARGPVSR